MHLTKQFLNLYRVHLLSYRQHLVKIWSYHHRNVPLSSINYTFHLGNRVVKRTPGCSSGNFNLVCCLSVWISKLLTVLRSASIRSVWISLILALLFQIRLDFNNFIITGPSTDSASVGKLLNGELATGAGKEVTDATQCLTDTFTVTGQSTLPYICGINNGQHGK